MKKSSKPGLIEVFISLANGKTPDARGEAIKNLLLELARESERQRNKSSRELFPFPVLKMTEEAILEIAQETEKILRQLAATGAALTVMADPQASEVEKHEAFGAAHRSTVTLPDWATPRTLKVMPDGNVERIQQPPDIWFYLIQTLDVVSDVRRIKECKICNNLFWANRSNQKTCSPAHANAWRQRTYYNAHHRIARKDEG